MKQNRKIWLVNYYAMPPEHESRLRTIKFAQYLSSYGYEPIIISSSFLHNKNINLIDSDSRFVFKKYGNLNFIHIRTKGYKSNGILRLFDLINFHIKLHRISNKLEQPDIILHTCLPPFGIFTVFTAIKLKAKYLAEVLDLWPESFLAFNLVKKSNPLLKLAFLIEKWMYRKADGIIFSMEGGIDYIRNKGWLGDGNYKINPDKIYYLNNGVDLDYFKTCSINYQLEDNDLSDPDTFKIIYIGSIRLANDLSHLINCSKFIRTAKQIKILIYGDGDQRESLENICKVNELKNIIFKEKWVNPMYIPYILERSDLNILNYQPNYIWQYGGSQSKLFQYIASGKPILSNLQMGYCLITKNQLGIARKFTSNLDYAEAIIGLINMTPNELQELKLRSEQIIQKFDYQSLTKELQLIIDKVNIN